VESPEPVMKRLDDIGTRYVHLKDLADSWEATIEIITNRGVQNIPDGKQRLQKLCVAYEILNITIDSFAEYKDPDKQYELYRAVESCSNLPNMLGGTECKSS